jgi:serine/threonine protein kinase
VYRKRCKTNTPWKESDLVTILFSLISSCSYLQKKGICHRDIKPANLFLMQNGEVKLIDFGESKDYIYDLNDESRETYTRATIRGTPQYLSPILWKAHVVDGNSRYVEHNIYKSDVFSAGLVLLQLALM